MGCANIARRSMLPVLRNHPLFELVAVASRGISKSREVADLFGCEALEGYDTLVNRSDIDAIYMPLPTGLHKEWVEKCVMAGKHILVEKSLAMNFEELRHMLELARERKCVIMEDFMYRYHSQYRFVFDHLSSGTIGDTRVLIAKFGFPPLPLDNFRYKKDLGGGALLDAAAYTVNVSLWMLGSGLEVASASLFYDRKEDVCIHGSAMLVDRTNGTSAQIAFGFDNFYQCNLELWGSKGQIFMDRAFTPPPDFSPLVRVSKQGSAEEFRLDKDNHFHNIVSEFGDCINKSDYLRHQDELYHQSRVLTELEVKGQKNWI